MNQSLNNPELNLEQMVIRELQGDLPLTPKPYAEIAQRLGVSEGEVLAILQHLLETHAIRRLGAVLRHHQLGFRANGMGIWRVPAGDVERVGLIMTTFPQVSHCYERPTSPTWKYNMYTMIHGHSPEECQEVARRISEQTGIRDYQVLFSIREFKKASMRYY